MVQIRPAVTYREIEAQKSPTQIVAESLLSLYHTAKILFVTKNLRSQFVWEGQDQMQ